MTGSTQTELPLAPGRTPQAATAGIPGNRRPWPGVVKTKGAEQEGRLLAARKMSQSYIRRSKTPPKIPPKTPPAQRDLLACVAMADVSPEVRDALASFGRAIEALSGDEYEVYMEKNVLRPLGMARSYFDTTPYHLQRFRFDKIKIDRSFVKELARGTSIIKAVVSIAADREMVTTAEGVETEEQRATVHALGCTQMQGYLFSPPRPAQEVRALIAARKVVETAA